MNAPPADGYAGGSVFAYLADLFARHEVCPILVGGYALVAHKLQRTTFDIDFMLSADDCAKLEPDLMQAGYTVFNRQEAFVQFKSSKAGLRDLDFLIADEATIQKLAQQGTPVSIASRAFIAAPLEHSMAGENDLDLPIFQAEPSPPSVRSIDEIDAWIEHDLKYCFDREAYEKEKRRLSVNVPFKLS